MAVAQTFRYKHQYATCTGMQIVLTTIVKEYTILLQYFSGEYQFSQMNWGTNGVQKNVAIEFRHKGIVGAVQRLNHVE